MTWREIKVSMKFTTPAFLGGADKGAELRVPPFKHLIRFWWRVAVGKKFNYDHAKIREAEAKIFGNAWLKQSNKLLAERSRILIRLEKWDKGLGTSWSYNIKKVFHPEAGKNHSGMRVGADLYLGYGPLNYKQGTVLTNQITYIQPNTKFTLLLINDPLDPVTDTEFPAKRILELIHWFGTVGSRSANGWGSVVIDEIKQDGDKVTLPAALPDTNSLKEMGVLDSLSNCLSRDWPSAMATYPEAQPAIWIGPPTEKWEEAIRWLAALKIDFRLKLSIRNNNAREDRKKPGYPVNAVFDERHILAYPITHHATEGWAKWDKKKHKYIFDKRHYLVTDDRLKNQILFKVVQNKNQNNERSLTPVIFHLAHGIPTSMKNKPEERELPESSITKFHRDIRAIETKIEKLWTKEVYKAIEANSIIRENSFRQGAERIK